MSDYMGYGGAAGVGDAFDYRGTIMTDAPCRRCGYNLRGLQHTGRCPECGTPAGVSVCGDLLRFSHPRWLQRVSEGLSMILWGILVTFIGAVSGAVVFRQEPVVAQFITLMGTIIGTWGTWQMTTPDPSGIGETGNLNSRQLVRIAVIASLAGAAAQWLTTAGGVSLGGVVSLAVFQMVCGIMGIVGEFAKLQYIGRLAGRIPDESLSGRANSLKWGLAICYGLMLVLGVIVAIAAVSAFSGIAQGNRGGPGAGLLAAGCLVIPVGIALLVLAIMTIVLIYRMSHAVRGQIPLAMEIWSRAAQAAVPAPGDPAGAGAVAVPPPPPPPQDMRPRF